MAVKTKAELKALWITGYRPTQQDYADLFDSYLNIVDNPTPGWIRQVFNLEQDDVRTLNSANAGMGYELFEPAGANKIKQIANAIIIFKHTGGTYPQSLFQIFSETLGAPFLTFDNSALFGTDSGDVFAFITNTNPNPIAFQRANDALFLNAIADFPDYEGTAIMVCDYREVDFT